MTQNYNTINKDLFNLFDKSEWSNLSRKVLLGRYIPSFQLINCKKKIETQEVFKDITGYEGHYQASNKGNVKSLKRNSERIISPSIDKASGYFRVCLYKDNKRKSFSIHQLVAIAFWVINQMETQW